jgi:hypothetical protein
LAQNEKTQLSAFSEKNLTKFNNSTTKRAVLVQTGQRLLNFCKNKGSTYFPEIFFGT